MQLLNNIMTRPVPFDHHISEKSKDFIKKCLKVKEEDRMSWEEAFKHPLIQETFTRTKIEEDIRRNRFEEKENRRSAHRSKSKSTKKKSSMNKSPVHKTPSKTPRRSKNKNMSSDQNKSPWKC